MSESNDGTTSAYLASWTKNDKTIEDSDDVQRSTQSDEGHVLLIEPFYGGSHKQLVDLLVQKIPGCVKFCLPAKKWHWRVRTSALYFAQCISEVHQYRILFSSSVLNLAELIALRPDLTDLKKVLYFHENQLVYPVRKQQERDFQYGYNQIISCLVADVVVFNSEFNMNSFLTSVDSFLKLIPDHRPKGISDQIKPKCRVLYFPIPQITCNTRLSRPNDHPLHILWAHRWEHDKNPESFFDAIFHLLEEKLDFKVSVIGETFSEVPSIFAEAKTRLGYKVINWGYQQSREDYEAVLMDADLAVSTARHEFFGVAMLEAVQLGCYPLCPNNLAYPEIFPDVYLYSTQQQLAKKLRYFCKNPGFVRNHTLKVDVSRFSWENLGKDYQNLLS
ncbi:glycosyltransferase-like domain-containing protein 1 [Actinia tenebrosa]|uniref:tRNA-queuosine alpha-mannosyltransferase n=1 Tax=Actinia tenebrosa TaxID=6105 RepID=A0A6P8HCX8_ACTTE|nr:glycosyltransferase-like domain-containing protein 1 [Actinia tenebrosa]